MRSSFFWEATLVCLLIVVGFGAFSAWKAARPQPRTATPTPAQQNADAAVQAAVGAVKLHARFAMRMRGNVTIDEQSIEKTPSAADNNSTMWTVSGSGIGDSITADSFRWIVKVIDDQGKLTVRQVRLDGEVIFTAKEMGDSSALALEGLPAAS